MIAGLTPRTGRWELVRGASTAAFAVRSFGVATVVTLAPPPVPPGNRPDAVQGQAGRDALSMSAAAGAER